MAPSDTVFAYLSGGRIHLFGEGEDRPRIIESRFGQDLRERAVRIQQRHAWKTRGRGAQFMAGGLLWGMDQNEAAEMHVTILGLTRGRQPGELLYALDTPDVGGIFVVDTHAGEEQRLYHSNERRVEYPCPHPDPGQGLIACTVRHPGGTASLAVMRSDGSELTEITEGDSVDTAPCWVPGKDRQLVYQSAGMGRDPQGVALGLGPFGLHCLDLQSGEIADLIQDPDHDLLGPRVDPEGNVYCIRRPYRSLRSRGSIFRALVDFLLFPLRLLVALLQWLNFFTARYTGRPLTTAGGPRRQGADMKQMMIWGNLIDAGQAARRRQASEAPDLVPSTWQLVRVSGPGQATEVLARGVLAFDLCPDRTILYSNGSAIYSLIPGGRARRIHTAEQIEQVAVLSGPAPGPSCCGP